MSKLYRLEVEQLSKYYGKHKALSNVSFKIEPGEIVGLVGPNGAGKTTLMSIVVGLLKNYEGQIQINGSDIKRPNKTKRKQVGCVIENPGFYPDLTGYDNLVYFSKIFGDVKKRDIDDVIERLSLQHTINKKAKQYSLGMKQRLGIAQAILGEPELLILDEPTNGLDPNVIPEIRETIRYYAREKGISTLISSHILTEIEAMCDHALILKNGQLIDTIQLGDSKNPNHYSQYVFDTSEMEAVKSLLTKEGFKVGILCECQLIAELGEKDLSNVLPKIIEKGLSLRGVFPYVETLEEQFIKTVGVNRVE